ncbi:MAG: VOC family protein, partial [Candidatus Dormibacterales bacterium]
RAAAAPRSPPAGGGPRPRAGAGRRRGRAPPAPDAGTSRAGGEARHGLPRLRLDHVLVAVPGLEAAARDYLTRLGLKALPGGRHPGAGTANMIVPAGDAYIELITVVDQEEAARVPRSARVARALAGGRMFAGWAVRCPDLDAERRRLAALGWELPKPLPGSRRRPDGSVLRWRVQETQAGEGEAELPFLIEWGPAQHPSASDVVHPRGRLELGRLTVGSPRPHACADALGRLLGDAVDYEIATAPFPGLLQVRLEGDVSGTIP